MEGEIFREIIVPVIGARHLALLGSVERAKLPVNWIESGRASVNRPAVIARVVHREPVQSAASGMMGAPVPAE